VRSREKKGYINYGSQKPPAPPKKNIFGGELLILRNYTPVGAKLSPFTGL
jgi:hypothetical protein